MSYITFDQVCKDYGVGEQIVHAADHVTFGIEKGELCVVLGPSGAGKTTVLNLLGGMDKATSGTIQVGDKIITGMRGPQLTEYRRLDVGFVFQFYNLMPSLTALENVELARAGLPRPALDPGRCWTQVGLGAPNEQLPRPAFRRRTAARVHCPGAVQRTPRCCCATSPPARWTPKRASRCLTCCSRVSKTYNTTVVIITHNASIAPLGDRLIRMRNGGIQENAVNPHPAKVEDIAW